jgi:hypothetical protein
VKNLKKSGSGSGRVPVPPAQGKATPYRTPQPAEALAKTKGAKKWAAKTLVSGGSPTAHLTTLKSTALNDRELREAEILAPGFVANLVTERKPEELSRALGDLQGASEVVSVERHRLLHELLKSIVTEKGLLAGFVDSEPKIVVTYLFAADQVRIDVSGALAELSGSMRAVMENLLILHCRKKRDDTPSSSGDAAPPRAADKIGATLYDYMWQPGVLSVEEDWNDKSTGLAARVYNSLWNGGDYDKICDLIAMGVSTALACILPMNTGRGSTTEEGVWSGYVQPLDHLLSTYLKRVHDYERGALGKHENEAKVRGAKQVLEAMSTSESPGILTTYQEVMGSELLVAFEAQPGTFWGFEDVRLPYVEAARTKPGGMRPLRMMDLWAAVQDIITADNYRALLRNPTETIPKCVKGGIAKAEMAFDTLAAGKPNPSSEVNYALMLDDRTAYIEAFREQATDFLTFLSKQGPEAKLLTADLTGKDAAKMMGALACKAGLWWARQKGEPVYYCLDGINLDDVADYKTFKSKLINAGMTKREGEVSRKDLFYEVITLAEMREILREENWPLLKNTVKFVKLGKILKDTELDKIEKVRRRMARSDAKAPLRGAPTRAAFDSYVKELGLDPALAASLDTVTLKRVVTKAKVLGGVDAEAQHFLLFLEYLWDCQILYTSGVLPDVRVAFLDLAKEPDPAIRQNRAQMIVDDLNEFPQTSRYLRDILTGVARRIAAEDPIDISILAEELYPPDR